ncbi:hypothetical protein TNIN_431651 [Trichonephila inaurata madagascariensis]|uniref:Uncharacterized protein n=1 Tax=Trichonephila inaurata madagascariensis TaxID=2747483 RepID=A0A8X6X3E6_9ARAC|nr:hypothetical protein TNIN_431651 [Trichonephila inaurata madagascariensis]
MFPVEELQYAGFFAHCNCVYSDGCPFPAEVALVSIRDIKQYKAFTLNLSDLTFNHSDLILNQYYSDTKTNIVLSQTTRGTVKWSYANSHLYRMYNDMFQNLAVYHPKASIVYVYGPQQKALFKRFFRYLPVVDVLESPCLKNIPEPKNCKIILNGHRNFHDQKLPLACSFNRAYGYARLCKIKMAAFEEREENVSSESEEECNNVIME